MKKFTSLSKIKKASALLLLVAGATVAVAITSLQSAHSQAKLDVGDHDDDEPLSSSCGGTERWSEKVFTDADAGSIDFANPHQTGVTHLVGLPTVTPTSGNARIQPQEDSVYTVIVTIKEYRPESDSDCHLVITDGSSNTMVAEIPDPGCSSVAASSHKAAFILCREWAIKNLGTVINTSVNIPKVSITGVSFYDPPHGQSGASPNNMELHSVIDIHFYSPTGVDQIVDNYSASVFPNPSNGVFNVKLGANKGRLEVYNMLGQQVYTGELNNGNNTINMEGRSAGMYLYKVLSEEGGFISEGKMLIK
jgi:hypothetical protein